MMAHKVGYYSKKVVDEATGMNAIEKKYSIHLDNLRAEGSIYLWRFECQKFKLATKTWYMPDFKVLMMDGTIEFHETKGFLTHEANAKIKICAELFPEYIFRLVKEEKTTPEIKARAKALKVKIGTLKGWDITTYPPHKE